jgi:hypothetical protein
MNSFRRPIDVIKANRPTYSRRAQKMGGAATQNALKNNFNPCSPQLLGEHSPAQLVLCGRAGRLNRRL